MPQTAVKSKGEQTRDAIQRAATEAFREKGYDVATLEDIASGLGVTRSAVLHHFGSKAEILHEIVTPFLAELDALLDVAETQGVHGTRERRAFLTALVDLLCDRRCVAALLSRDITAHGHLEPAQQIGVRADRVVHLLSPDHHPAGTIKALAALGAVLRPLTASPDLVNLQRPEDRRALVNCALAALRA